MSGNKAILIVVTSHSRIDNEHTTGVWYEEFGIPFKRFMEHGFQITVASIEGGAAPIDPHSMPKDVHATDTQLALDALSHTTALRSLDFQLFDAVFFPGGHGAMYDFPRNPYVADIIGDYFVCGKVVAAVCHGPAAFLGAKREDGTAYVQGRNLTAFSNVEERAVKMDKWMPFMLEDELCVLGAIVHTAPGGHARVVVDENLITGQNPQSSEGVAKAIIKALSKD